MDVNELIALVHIKNDLNRKRRRFYHWMNRAPEWEHKIITIKYATEKYKETKLEMKAMTPKIREIRKQLNAKLHWGNYGGIVAISFEEQCISHKDFKKYHDNYIVEKILLT